MQESFVHVTLPTRGWEAHAGTICALVGDKKLKFIQIFFQKVNLYRGNSFYKMGFKNCSTK